ncbi:MAG TPA: XRE family transcriptional regulator [Devosia sp.]
MKLLSDLMIDLSSHIKLQGWTQKEAAKRLGVTQPRISDLTRGRIDLFSIDALVTMLARADFQLDLVAKPKASP